jgi:hypothetical protein
MKNLNQTRKASSCITAALSTLSLFICALTAPAAVVTDVSPGGLLGYSQLYELNIPNSFNFQTGGVPYTTDNTGTILYDSYSRVAYYFEVQRNASHPEGAGPREWVWASFDVWDQDAQFPSKIGVPNSGTGIVENGTVVNNMNVESNAPGITTGTGQTGLLEFWASNYNPNGGGQYGSSDTLWDWKDSGGDSSSGYGSMQIANITNSGSEHMLFGFNNFRGSGAMGIGTQSTGEPDWTFGPNASTYDVKNIEIWVGGRRIGRMVPEPSTTAHLLLGFAAMRFARWTLLGAAAKKAAEQLKR